MSAANSSGDVTAILNRIDEGDSIAANELFPLVYEELRRLASRRMSSERIDHTLQATCLVHEAYLRLAVGHQSDQWESRKHFFSAAANAMRQILIDSARSKLAQKRGGDSKRVPLVDAKDEVDQEFQEHLIDLDDALNDLDREDPDVAELVKLRVFGGLSVADAGKILGMSRSTAYEHWTYAKSWMSVRLSDLTWDVE